MGKLPFPRYQILLPNVTWLPWVSEDLSADTPWCSPDSEDGRLGADHLVKLIDQSKRWAGQSSAILVRSAEESNEHPVGSCPA